MARLRDLLALGGLLPGTVFGFTVACGGSTDIEFVGVGAGGEKGQSSCGDGQVDEGEECDDRNDEPGDGCSPACEIEAGWVCSGQPSNCAATCGNGTLDAGEACEDGNTDDGDGCSASCAIEGSCEAPRALTFRAASDGTLSAKIESSTRGGGRQVEAAACGDETVGAGADRVFEFELEERADVLVRVSGGFNTTVRVLDEPCELEETLACSNAGDGNADESLLLPNLAPGKYFIIVDGVARTSSGDFTLNVTASCPVENVKIDAVDTYLLLGVTLKNVSDSCAVKLEGLGMSFDWMSENVSEQLKDHLLEPGETFTLSTYDYQSPVPASHQSIDQMYWSYTGGAAYLCRGACTSSGSNVIDAVQFGANPPTLRSRVSFDPSPLVGVNTYNEAYFGGYLRAAYEGGAREFLASDWQVFFQALPRRYPYSSGWALSSGAMGAISVVDDPEHGKAFQFTNTRALDLSGNGLFTAVVPELRPSYIRYRFLLPTLPATGEVGDVWIGRTGLTYALGYSYVFGSMLRFIGGGEYGILPNSWYLIEYRDIDWEAKTYDVWIDETLFESDLPFLESSLESLNVIEVGNYSGGYSLRLAEMLMR